MMIIKRGMLPELQIWTGSCINCGTVIEMELKEADQSTIDLDEDWAQAKHPCPVCHKGPNMILHPKRT